MKHWPSRKPDQTPAAAAEAVSGAVPGTVSEVAPQAGWFGPVDAAIAAGCVMLALTVSVPVALHFRKEARQLDHARTESMSRTRQLRSTLDRSEARHVALTQFRREVSRYVSEVEAKPMVPWTTVVGELSRRRPAGVWTTRLSGSGPHFRAQVAAERPELVTQFTQSLRESPYVDFAALPAGVAPATQSQVVGRLRGE
ncbi:MAG: hypothetical protein K0Q72_5372 [Armatimonadetes bacterium]|jgi:hypothetical protein|nr:hypothetical protein [Armatimonadota bacterium]